jgi:hypothetical protein
MEGVQATHGIQSWSRNTILYLHAIHFSVTQNASPALVSNAAAYLTAVTEHAHDRYLWERFIGADFRLG